MTTDYNKIAEQYREVKGRPWRSLVAEYFASKRGTPKEKRFQEPIS